MIVFLAALIACGNKKPANNNNANASRGGSTVVLDGQEISVTWQDGDTFSYSANGQSKNARLHGFNTLESYGPVHRWGNWRKSELLGIADAATALAQSESWECTTMEGGGGYGRNLIDCPGLRRRLIRQGLAHAYFLNADIPPELLAVQRTAIEGQRGMWEKGVPEGIITSLHSRTEDLNGGPYNRVCDVNTGRCIKIDHNERYETCQDVTMQGSTMVYVPYENRYNNKPECLN